MTTHNRSVTVDLRSIKTRKEFMLVTSLIRSCVVIQHGFAATTGLTDSRFRNWSLAIRFKTAKNRDEFYSGIQSVLHPNLFKKIGFKSTIPRMALSEPIKNLPAS